MYIAAVLTCVGSRTVISRMAKKTLSQNRNGGRLIFHAAATNGKGRGRGTGTKTGGFASLLKEARMFQAVSEIHSAIDRGLIPYCLQPAFTVGNGFADERKSQ